MDRGTQTVVLYGLGIAGAYLLLRPLIPDLKGALSDPGGRKVDDAIASSANPASPWNPGFWRSKPGALIITQAGSDKLVRDLLSSVNVFYLYDDFAKALGVFKQLKTQSQVSYLAERFRQATGSDLLAWLRGSTYPFDAFSNEEVGTIINYVNSLPKYQPL